VIEERSTGIILRTRPLTETSLIVHWLTPEFGRLATVAKGARRPKSPFRGKIDLFHTAEFSFSRSRRSELHTLREAVLQQTHPALRQDLSRLQHAAYAVSLLELATEPDTPIPEIFHLFDRWLNHLDQQPATVQSLLLFELRLLQELGLSPPADARELTEPARHLMGQLLSCDWPSLAALPPDPKLGQRLEQFLGLFLVRHLGRVPRGRQTALASVADPG